MPAKKKKTTTTKKKTTRKKTATKSSSTKKKPVKKKTTAKKTATKKKAPAKKKVTRKKSVVQKDRMVEVKHASEVHSLTTKHVSLVEKSTKSVEHPTKGFSFPSALSQVRGFVSVNKQEETLPPEKEEKRVKKEVAVSSEFVSPYVLDLREQKTLLHGVQPKSYKQEKKEKETNTQSVMSLFEPVKKKPLGESLQGMKSFGQQFRVQKSTNFAPIKHQFKPGSTLKRWVRAFQWRWSFRMAQIKKPIHQARAKKMQKAFSMPKHLGAHAAPHLVSNQTRSGKPISSSVFARVKREEKKIIRKEKQSFQKKRLPQLSTGFFSSAFSVQRAAMSFAALCFLFVLPIGGVSLYQKLQRAQGEVFGATGVALQDLEKAQLHASQLDFISASEHFAQAGQAFQAAAAVMENELGPFGDVVASLPAIGDQVKTGKKLLESGDTLAKAASLLTQAVDVLNNENHFLADQALSYKLEFVFVRIEESAPLLTKAAADLEEVDVSVLPEEYRAKISALQKSLPTVVDEFNRLSELGNAVLPLIGHDSLQRYLVAFQNNTELRATGGFFGSMALVDLDLGEISGIEVPGGGPYDYQGSFLDYYEAPRALQLINPRFELHDANWFYDWPTSAKTMSSFYEKAGGPTVDGVIAIDTQVLEELLALVGPIRLEAYDMELDAENFRSLLQEEVEFNYDQELNQPKKIIGELVPLILEELKQLEPKEYLALGETFNSLLEKKDIMVYHADEDIQSVFSTLGWSGEVVDTKADYLAIVHTNLAGGKTDGVIQDQFDLDVHIDANGEVTNTLTVTRTHNGTRGVPLTGVRNVDYMRVYVPKGAELVSATSSNIPPAELFESPGEDWQVLQALLPYQENYRVDESSGVEVFEESGKTVFGQWVQVDPQEVVEVKLVYKVPGALLTYDVPEREDSWLDWFTGNTAHTPDNLRLYHLYWQKQSGVWSPELDITINYPQQWQAQSHSSVTGQPGAGTWKAQALQEGDSIWGLMMY